MEEHRFRLTDADGKTRVVTVESDDYDEAAELIEEIRDRDFPGAEIADE